MSETFILRQITGLIARRIVAWAQEEYRVPLKPSDDEEESAQSGDGGKGEND